MSRSQVHELRNILVVILAAIENGNLELARQAVRRAADHLASCKACPIGPAHEAMNETDGLSM